MITAKMIQDDFLDYFNGALSVLGVRYKSKDIFLGLFYFIAQETQKIKSSKFYLEYFKVNEFDYVNYYFFDPKFKIYIGFLNVEETRPNKLFPRNTYKVSLSMIETTLIGQGYGKSMYLSVIDDVDCLLSDEYLYKGSANIWINVLWRYYESVGFYDRNWQEYLKLPLQYDRNWADRVAYFFASKNPNLIKKLLKYNTKNRR